MPDGPVVRDGTAARTISNDAFGQQLALNRRKCLLCQVFRHQCSIKVWD